MTKTLEAIAAFLGVFGFVVSTVHVVWTMRQHISRLDVAAKAGRIFDMKIHAASPALWHEKVQNVTIIDVVVEILNRSVRDNSVVFMSWHGKEVNGHTQEAYYEDYCIPSVQWDDVLPVIIPEGEYFQAHCSGVVTDPQAIGNPPSISVAVTDAFGKTYRASVALSPCHSYCLVCAQYNV